MATPTTSLKQLLPENKKFYITYFTYGEEMPSISSSAWLETPSVGIENKIKASVEKCFFAVEQRVLFTSRPLLPAIKNDLLPASLLCNVVYNFLVTVIVGT